MPVTMARIDQKLIHGQITAGWVPYLGIEEIVVIDDMVSEDDMTQAILAAGVPDKVGASFVAEAEAACFLAHPAARSPRRLLIFGSVPGVRNALTNGLVLESLNLGNMAASTEAKRIRLSDSFHVTSGDLDILGGLSMAGLNLYLQAVPGDRPVPFVRPAPPAGPTGPAGSGRTA